VRSVTGLGKNLGESTSNSAKLGPRIVRPDSASETSEPPLETSGATNAPPDERPDELDVIGTSAALETGRNGGSGIGESVDPLRP
jgi:hypothetical protein